jgi:hypothetical protein
MPGISMSGIWKPPPAKVNSIAQRSTSEPGTATRQHAQRRRSLMATTQQRIQRPPRARPTLAARAGGAQQESRRTASKMSSSLGEA